jgi:hypothetical protein
MAMATTTADDLININTYQYQYDAWHNPKVEVGRGRDTVAEEVGRISMQ